MRYTDLAIIHAFSPLRGKRDFQTFMNAEFDSAIEDTPESRVYWMGKYIEKVEKNDMVEKIKSFSHSELVSESSSWNQYPEIIHEMSSVRDSVWPKQEPPLIPPSKGDSETNSFILQLESDLIPVLARMEEKGVAVDEAKLRDIGERIRTDIFRTEKEIYEVVGERFNINSPKQIQVILFEKLGIKPSKKNKTGYSVDTEVLEEIAKEYDIARLILEYRTLAKLDSTYITGLLKSINPITRRIHTTYDSLGAATGRMSSNDPNLQNIPTGIGYAREIKSCFVATPQMKNSKFKIQNYGTDSSRTQNDKAGNLVPNGILFDKSWILNLESNNILLVADYSQVELRVLAFLSQDENLLDAFEKGEDIHTRTARFLFKTPLSRGDGGSQGGFVSIPSWERGQGDLVSENSEQNPQSRVTRDCPLDREPVWKPTPEQRRIAKTVNFGVIYGITGFGLSKTLGCSPYEANQYIDAFYTKYPKVREYYDILLENARKTGYVETYFGRRRYIHSINDANKTIRSIAEREAMNMPVQGTAADMIKLAMVELDAKIREKQLHGSMILQVHDELVFDIPENEQEIFEKLVREVMEGVLIKNSKFKMQNNETTESWILIFESWIIFPPIVVDISVGKDWAEAK
jgi:DNA polymerase-1